MQSRTRLCNSTLLSSSLVRLPAGYAPQSSWRFSSRSRAVTHSPSPLSPLATPSRQLFLHARRAHGLSQLFKGPTNQYTRGPHSFYTHVTRPVQISLVHSRDTQIDHSAQHESSCSKERKQSAMAAARATRGRMQGRCVSGRRR